MSEDSLLHMTSSHMHVYFDFKFILKMQGNARKRKETQGNARKQKETQGNARKRKKTQGNARKRKERKETQGEKKLTTIRASYYFESHLTLTWKIHFEGFLI